MRWWHGLSIAWKWFLGIPSFVAAVVAAVKGWNWLLGLYDAPVLRFLEERSEYARKHPRGNVIPMNASPDEIADDVSRSRVSVLRSLKRLKRQQKVLDHHDGWSLYPSESKRNLGRFKSRFEG